MVTQIKNGFILFVLFYGIRFCNSQSLSHDRIEKIKSCTVRITIQDRNSMGTGFFIDNAGSVLTCWH
ncbi:MAG TPA: hypothetical protein VIL78_15750, partial [Hanamia sp.]